MADKGFVSERGFGKLNSPFYEIIEKTGWESLLHTRYLDSLLWQGNSKETCGDERRHNFHARSLVTLWHKRINEMFKLKELKNGSKFKKLVENPNHEKIIDLLTAGQGK